MQPLDNGRHLPCRLRRLARLHRVRVRGIELRGRLCALQLPAARPHLTPVLELGIDQRQHAPTARTQTQLTRAASSFGSKRCSERCLRSMSSFAQLRTTRCLCLLDVGRAPPPLQRHIPVPKQDDLGSDARLRLRLHRLPRVADGARLFLKEPIRLVQARDRRASRR